MKFSACSKVKKFSALIFSMVFMSFSLFCEELSFSQEKYHGESSTDSVLIRQAEDFMMEYIPYEDKTMDRLVFVMMKAGFLTEQCIPRPIFWGKVSFPGK